MGIWQGLAQGLGGYEKGKRDEDEYQRKARHQALLDSISELELDKLKNPKPKVAEPYTLNAGDTRYGADNTVIATAPTAPKLEPYHAPEIRESDKGFFVVGPDGKAVAVTMDGKPVLGKRKETEADKPPRPTDAELRSKGFAQTLARLNPLIAGYEKAGVQPNAIAEGLEGVGSIPILGNVVKPVTGQVANSMRTDEQRQYKNYARQWMIAVLRPESGGAISDQEFDNYYKTYFKQPGDDATTVSQKQIARNDKEREAGIRGGQSEAVAPANAGGGTPPNGGRRYDKFRSR